MAAIPLFNPKAQYGPLLPELKERLGAVLDGGRFILGPEVRAFEEEAAASLGVSQTIGVANGTDAIALVLNALGIGPGDEVIVPAYTFPATANAVELCGAKAVLVDVDPATFNTTPERVAAALTPRSRAVLAVHLFGRPLDWAGLGAHAALLDGGVDHEVVPGPAQRGDGGTADPRPVLDRAQAGTEVPGPSDGLVHGGHAERGQLVHDG